MLSPRQLCLAASLLMMSGACARSSSSVATAQASVQGQPAAKPKPKAQPEAHDQSYSVAETTLRYLANEGVLLRRGHRMVVIDGFHRFYRRSYEVLTKAEREALETAQGSYAGIDLILVTHRHKDHFNADAVLRHMEHNLDAEFVGPPQVIAELAARPMFRKLKSRVHEIPWRPGQRNSLEIRGIKVDALGLRHAGLPNAQVEHLAYLVTLGEVTFGHFGDGDGTPHDLGPHELAPMHLDAALVPAWWVDEADGAGVVRRYVRAHQVFVGNIDPNDPLVLQRLAESYPKAVPLTEKLKHWTLDAL